MGASVQPYRRHEALEVTSVIHMDIILSYTHAPHPSLHREVNKVVAIRRAIDNDIRSPALGVVAIRHTTDLVVPALAAKATGDLHRLAVHVAQELEALHKFCVHLTFSAATFAGHFLNRKILSKT